jgi:GT2 family glycosyltransferase
MELSVVIVSYNVRYFLELCLHSVIKASETIECEVFVIDNNSTDNSAEMVANMFGEVILIRNNENKGFSFACNQGIKIAHGRYILLLNPDTIVEENSFRSCINFMAVHPDAGALGVKMFDGRGRFLPESKRTLPEPRNSFFKIFGLSRLFPRSSFFNYYHFPHLDNSKTGKVEVISGAFMFLSREALAKTGNLDEDFFMYGEDIDLSYRLIKAGFNNYYFPETRIIHYKGESTDKGRLKYVIHFYRAMLIFFRKHYGNKSRKYLILSVKTAIYFKASLAVLKRVLINICLPIRHFLRNHLAKYRLGSVMNSFCREKRTAIAGDKESYSAVTRLIEGNGSGNLIIGRISPNHEERTPGLLGNTDQIREIILEHKIEELIFTSSGIKVSEIIDLMNTISDMYVKTRISPPGEKYIIGSNSCNERGEVYSPDNKTV